MQVDEVSWHDAVFDNVNLSAGQSSGLSSTAVLTMKAYLRREDSERTDVRIVCLGVQKVIVNVSFFELSDNRRAGNVSNLYLKPLPGQNFLALWIYLVDGIIEVIAQEFDLEF